MLRALQVIEGNRKYIIILDNVMVVEKHSELTLLIKGSTVQTIKFKTAERNNEVYEYLYKAIRNNGKELLTI